jgi:hypothetical protein
VVVLGEARCIGQVGKAVLVFRAAVRVLLWSLLQPVNEVIVGHVEVLRLD